MTIPLHVTFRNMKHPAEVEDWIREEVEKLLTFCDRITGCNVAVEVPHRRHRKGKPLHIRIDLALPGQEIVVKRESNGLHLNTVEGHGAAPAHARPHADLQLVIHDAFKSAGRRVQDFARRRRGKVKRHETALSTS